MKAYALKRKYILERGLDTAALSLQGYASFLNETEYSVIGSNSNYKENLFLLIAGLIALATFITIASPLLINAHYTAIYAWASEMHTNAIFLIWGTVIMCSMATIGILAVDVYYLLIESLMTPNLSSKWICCLSIVLATVYFLLDLLLAILVKKKNDFPLPYMLSFLFCCKNTIVAQTLAILSAITFMQLASFHLTFIFLAFVASPVQTGSTFLLYVTGLLSGISLTTLFLAAFQKRVMTNAQRRHILSSYCIKFLHLIMFICILVFTIFFATCFIRITIYVGDIQSGGIPSLIATLTPSALLAGLGYLGKMVLEGYVPRDLILKDDTELNIKSTSVSEGMETTESDDGLDQQNSSSADDNSTDHEVLS